MRFSCDSCHTRYRIEDEKLRGKILRVRCKKCGSSIVLNEPEEKPKDARPRDDDATHVVKVDDIRKAIHDSGDHPPEAASLPGTAAGKFVSRSSLTPPRSIAPVAAPPAPAERPEWYVLVHREEVGPLLMEELRARARSGVITPRTYVWRDGMPNWERLQTVEPLSQILESIPSGSSLTIPSRSVPGQRIRPIETRTTTDQSVARTKIEPHLEPEAPSIPAAAHQPTAPAPERPGADAAVPAAPPKSGAAPTAPTTSVRASQAPSAPARVKPAPAAQPVSEPTEPVFPFDGVHFGTEQSSQPSLPPAKKPGIQPPASASRAPAVEERPPEEVLEDIRLAEEARLAAEASAWAEDAARLNTESKVDAKSEKTQPASGSAFELEEPLPALLLGDEESVTETPHAGGQADSAITAALAEAAAENAPLPAAVEPSIPAPGPGPTSAEPTAPLPGVDVSFTPSVSPLDQQSLAHELRQAAEETSVAAMSPAAQSSPPVQVRVLLAEDRPAALAPSMMPAPSIANERRPLKPVEMSMRELSRPQATMATRNSRPSRRPQEHSQNTSAIIRNAVKTRIRWVPVLLWGSVGLLAVGAMTYVGVETQKAVVAPKKAPPPPPKVVQAKPKPVEAPRPTKTVTHTHAHTATSLTPAQVAAFDAVQNDMASHRPAMRELPQLGADDIDLNREAPSGAGIDEKVLKKRMKQIQPGIESCVTSAFQRNPDLKVGKVNVTITVGSSGIVTKVAFDRSSFGSTDLGHCIEERVKTIVLPSFEGDSEQVEFPLAIASGG